MAQMVKRLPTIWEAWVLSLVWEDPLEKEMAIQFRILAWEIPWTEEPGRLQFMGSQRRTGKPGMLHFMGLQRVGHNLVTEEQQV